MTIAQLKDALRVINLAALAREADLSEDALRGKLKRDSELTVTESRALERALRGVGLEVREEAQ